MKNKRIIIAFGVVSILLLLWWVFTINQNSSQKLLFPSPELLLQTLSERYIELAQFSFTTWYRVLVGLFVGSYLGFITGLLMSYNNMVNYILDPIIELIRPIPPVALTPFFILWFGLGDLSQLLLIAIGCYMIITITTYEAVRNVNPVFIRAARSLGAKPLDLYLTVIIPNIIPNLLPGLRVALATSFALTVAAEYLGAQGGLGFVIRNART
ncbi:MAG: ABC transporter permease, partial [Flavobacteriaceae bacterium]|nr:ABC transporter permease [Flavobacteriaceae bacterium]